MRLNIHDKAPEFNLPDQSGTMHRLADHRGEWVLLYFYPKDDTMGCTKEACMIRDRHPDFEAIKAKVFGVSTDSVESHKKFAEKYNLPFTILADPEKQVVKAYDVWKPKKFMGREFLGTLRTSFLIDPEGRIAKIYEGVKPAIHAEEVLKDLEEFQKGQKE